MKTALVLVFTLLSAHSTFATEEAEHAGKKLCEYVRSFSRGSMHFMECVSEVNSILKTGGTTVGKMVCGICDKAHNFRYSDAVADARKDCYVGARELGF